MKLIVDADIIAYQSCAAVEKEVQWDDDTFTLHSTLEDAKAVFYEFFHDLKASADTDDVIFCWSSFTNWRKQLDETYKAHRKGVRKPLAYLALKHYINAHYDNVTFPNLEGDDVLGILATRNPECVIWSLDKDLKQIPGKHLVDDEVIEISREAADRFHLYQTLVGDASDGYKGCPGIGPVKAEKIVDGGWVAVCDAYVKAGLTENDAIHQARLARILRDGEYDEENNEVQLWTP